MSTAALWTKHRSVARNIAGTFTIRGLEREDVEQEAFEALWRAARSHVPELGPFRPWAIRVITAHLADLLKAAMREKRTGHLVELRDVYAAPDPGRQLRDLVDLLPTLTQLERDAVAARLNGTYERRHHNALYTARRKLEKAAA